MSKVIEEMQNVRNERQDSYGNPEDSFEIIAGLWEVYLNNRFSDGRIVLSSVDISLLMVLLKVARTIGGADKLDNYVDMANYAAIAGDVKFKK